MQLPSAKRFLDFDSNREFEMPQSETLHRPQTLKQAKKAFKKAGALPRFSDAEIRRLNRAAELQERADRAKEKERKRKANLKKREERLAKEREARKKAHLPDVKEAHIAASQLQLAFPDGAIKRKEGRNRAALGDDSVQPRQNNPKPTDDAGVSMLKCPLQQITPTVAMSSKSAPFAMSENPWNTCVEDWDEFLVSNTQLERELSAPRVKAPPMICTRDPAPTSTESDDPIDMLDLISTQDLESLTKIPPPITIVAVKESRFKSDPIRGGPEVKTKVQAKATLMEKYSLPGSEASTDDFEPDGLLTDEELRDLTQSFELDPDLKLEPLAGDKNISPCARIDPTHVAPGIEDVEDSFYDEHAPLSQELLDLASSYEFDDFALSTQELQDLVP